MKIRDALLPALLGCVLLVWRLEEGSVNPLLLESKLLDTRAGMFQMCAGRMTPFDLSCRGFSPPGLPFAQDCN